MATETREVLNETFKCATDLSANQFYAVKITATDTIGIVAAATDRAIGILQNKPKSGHGAAVAMLGIYKAIADGSGTAIAAGDYVGANSSGVLVKKATADYTVMGIALEGCSAANLIIRVFVFPGFFRSAGG